MKIFLGLFALLASTFFPTLACRLNTKSPFSPNYTLGGTFQAFNSPLGNGNRSQKNLQQFQRNFGTEGEKFKLYLNTSYTAHFISWPDSTVHVDMDRYLGDGNSLLFYTIKYKNFLDRFTSKDYELSILAIPKLDVGKSLLLFGSSFDWNFENEELKRMIYEKLHGVEIEEYQLIVINHLVLNGHNIGKYPFQRVKISEKFLTWPKIEELLLRTKMGREYWDR